MPPDWTVYDPGSGYYVDWGTGTYYDAQGNIVGDPTGTSSLPPLPSDLPPLPPPPLPVLPPAPSMPPATPSAPVGSSANAIFQQISNDITSIFGAGNPVSQGVNKVGAALGLNVPTSTPSTINPPLTQAQKDEKALLWVAAGLLILKFVL